MEKDFLKHINENQGIILKVCRMYGGNDVAEGEDLFQEIVLQLWQSYPNFRGEAKVSTWMYRIAINTAITGLRKHKRRPDSQRLMPSSTNIPEQHHKRRDIELGPALQNAIDRLNKFDRALVMLYLDEKSYAEMAEIMGISESNIGVKINRIKGKLKTILNP